MKKKQKYERKLTQIIPNAFFTFQKSPHLSLLGCLFCNTTCQYYKNNFHFIHTFPTAITQQQFTIRLVMETSADKDAVFPSYACHIYVHRSEQLIGLWLIQQPYPLLSVLYVIPVRQARCLPPASFRFRLATDTLALGYVIPAIRAHSGLTPVRQCSCRVY